MILGGRLLAAAQLETSIENLSMDLERIQAAAQRLRGQVLHTPCVESRTLSEITGAQVFLKFENLQFTA